MIATLVAGNAGVIVAASSVSDTLERGQQLISRGEHTQALALLEPLTSAGSSSCMSWRTPNAGIIG